MSGLSDALTTLIPWVKGDERGLEPDAMFLSVFRRLFGLDKAIHDVDFGVNWEQVARAYELDVLPHFPLLNIESPVLDLGEISGGFTTSRVTEFKEADFDIIHCPVQIEASHYTSHVLYTALIKLDEGVFVMILNRGFGVQPISLALYPVENPSAISASWLDRLFEE